VCAPLLAFVPPKRPTRLARLAGGPALARPIALSCRYLPAPLMRRLTMGFVTTALAPAPRLFEHGAILVNVEGRRFCEERSQPASEVPKQPYRIAFIVLDRELAERFEAWPNCISTAPGIGHTYFSDHRRRGAMVREARTVEKLAEALGVPTQTLARTIAHYNADARGTRPALSRPPFFALGPVKSYCAYTDGGLRVSERLEVLAGSGSPIPGLFAAGAAGQGGLLLDGQGDRLAWAFVSGRVAGRTVAAAERAMSEVLA
jgi:succinate dehydrogenase/fumarate reductase flavoprotein subunit